MFLQSQSPLRILMDSRFDVSVLCFWLFAVCTVVDNAAVISTIVSAIHHLWGQEHVSTFVEQPVGTTPLKTNPPLAEKGYQGGRFKSEYTA